MEITDNISKNSLVRVEGIEVEEKIDTEKVETVLRLSLS